MGGPPSERRRGRCSQVHAVAHRPKGRASAACATLASRPLLRTCCRSASSSPCPQTWRPASCLKAYIAASQKAAGGGSGVIKKHKPPNNAARGQRHAPPAGAWHPSGQAAPKTLLRAPLLWCDGFGGPAGGCAICADQSYASSVSPNASQVRVCVCCERLKGREVRAVERRGGSLWCQKQRVIASVCGWRKTSWADASGV